MNKEELLQELSQKIYTGELSREEVLGRLGGVGVSQNTEAGGIKKFFNFSFTKMLYVLGAAIAVIGMVIFVAQVWDDIGSFGRIAVTLGLGLLLAGIGAILLNQKPDQSIGAVFHVMGGLLIPGGVVVTLYEVSRDLVTLWTMTVTFGVIFAFYLLLNFVQKHPVLTFFSIAHGTAFVYLLVAALNEDLNLPGDIYAYLTMALGASYLLLGHALREGRNKELTWILYLLGSAGFLAAAFSQVSESLLWELGYFLIVLAGLYLAVFMKSRSILTTSTIALLVHVAYITGEYFANSLGWPISLVILGFLFIGLGYVSVSINKKYIKGDS